MHEFNWNACYDRMHDSAPKRSMSPVIGITGNYGTKGCELAKGYYYSLLKAGATPLIIPPHTEPDAIRATLDRIDGLLLSGGGDLNPLYMGEEPLPALGSVNHERDLAELLLIRMAADRQIPILGICRGIQMLTAALGGEVYQDIASQHILPAKEKRIKHSQDLDRSCPSHTVSVKEGSLLSRIFPDTTTLAVNSFHHQAVKDPGQRLRICATAPDGVIEAVESAEYKSILGVQWHPEGFMLAGDESMKPLFQWLANEAADFAAARHFHDRNLSLDSHCDTPMFFHKDIHFEKRDPNILVDLHKMNEGRLDASVMVAYIPQGPCTPEGYDEAFAKANSILDQLEKMVAASPQAVDLAKSPADLYRLKREGRKAIMRGIENGYAIGDDIEHLNHFAQRGIVYMTLCHNGHNAICTSARPSSSEDKGIIKPSAPGITPFGEKVIREMNAKGIMVDLSHASEASFYDALDISKQPIVCSHSSARALCDHPRNLTDEQMQALAAKDGVMQVTFYEGFLRTDGKASILDAVAHIKHAVDIMGIEHVGIGTDFDGDGGVPGLASASELINLTRYLLRESYSESDIALLWGGNFLRVMEQIQNVRIS
ncbi:MAG: gamma-glutamyl-gamma-aminobutyrate hydrolase family protein [Bacteroidaceae bacterium]|nr:gamma-glutamyl-gamma-aminobutyrate hydrolase family protein [Bacteroidaceae bacterium]